MFKGNNTKEAPTNQTNQINRFVEGTTIKGDLVSESNVRVDGTLIGNISVKGKLVLGPGGRVEGEVKCLNADIEGSIQGNINVDGLLILKETANIEGNITTNKIGVLEGAQFTGKCIMNPNSSQIINEDISLEPDASQEMVY